MNSDHNPVSLILSLTCFSLISEEIWVEILKRLPVQTLCRFRSVCKSWNSLISSSYFIKLQNTFMASITPFNHKPYLIHSFTYTYHFYHPQDLDQHLKNPRFPFGLREAAKLVDKRRKWDMSFKVLDVVHGLVCLYYSLMSSFDSVVVWNPVIRKYVALPRLPKETKTVEEWYQPPKSIGLGFGYCSYKNAYDFKVLRVWIPSGLYDPKFRSLPSRFEIFSSKIGLWREEIVENIKSYQFITTTSCFVNGTIHWVVSIPNVREDYEIHHKYSLLMFDCEQEKFSVMELPEEINKFQRVNAPYGASLFTKLFKYADKLSVLVYSTKEGLLELWAMEEYGVSTSWKNLFRIRKEIQFHSSHVVMLRENGDIYQPEVARLATYNPNQWMKRIGRKTFYQPLKGHIYEESMYLMDDPNACSYSNEEEVHF